MSRSYRKPYSAITGIKSAADDKRVARRGVRAAQNQAIKQFRGDWDEFLLPERYECSFNDTWSWGRDGCQSLQFEPRIEDYLKRVESWSLYDYTPEDAESDFQRAKDWYQTIQRK